MNYQIKNVTLNPYKFPKFGLIARMLLITHMSSLAA